MEKLSAPYNFKEGALLLIDKPIEWTSFDVVNKLRYKLKHKYKVKKFKVGHAGTLDPLATGLLIICTGKFTKKLSDLQGLYKSYSGQIKLGATTASFDKETQEDQYYSTDHISAELIEKTKSQFLGDILQTPPIFSALKVNGVRSYKHARQGKAVKLEARKLHIYEFETSNFKDNHLDFHIKCSKGTYIRSIANDFGKALESGGYLTALRRTSIGEYSIDDAWQLDDLLELIEQMEIPVEENK